MKVDRYATGALQYSRGCPFECEFCDIIVTFGRRPRLKTAPQILAELDALRAQGMGMVFVVDDKDVHRGILTAEAESEVRFTQMSADSAPAAVVTPLPAPAGPTTPPVTYPANGTTVVVSVWASPSILEW